MNFLDIKLLGSDKNEHTLRELSREKSYFIFLPKGQYSWLQY